VGATVLARRDRTANASSRARAAVEKLLAGGYEEHELAEAARTAKLALDGSYVAVAVEQFPPNAMSLEALASTVARALAGRGGDARSGVVGRLVGVIVPRSAAQPTVLAAAQRSLPGVELRLGIGDTANLGELRRSWKHAQESLALGSLVNGVEPGVVFFDDLGVLHLLAQIPTSEVVASRLFHVLNDSLTHRGTPSDADVLEAYLEEGTLRRAAARVFLHHTTVEHRLKRIELQLGLDLGQPPARFQAQLLLKLHRIVRLQDAART